MLFYQHTSRKKDFVCTKNKYKKRLQVELDFLSNTDTDIILDSVSKKQTPIYNEHFCELYIYFIFYLKKYFIL